MFTGHLATGLVLKKMERRLNLRWIVLYGALPRFPAWDFGFAWRGTKTKTYPSMESVALNNGFLVNV
jgi:hypothetical protein